MAENTKIEWAHDTFNPWWGCERVSPLCDHCYAATLDKRTGGNHWGPSRPRRYIKSGWSAVLKWNRAAEEAGERRRVFCASMADIWESHDGPVVNTKGERLYTTGEGLRVTETLKAQNVDKLRPLTLADLRARVFRLIGETPWLDWILLTKRPANALRMAPQEWRDGWPPNVWAMTSAGTQQELGRVIPQLLRIPARIRGLSIEPLLESCLLPIDFCRLDWVIVGGESGAKSSRIMHPQWVRYMRDQAHRYEIPFFFKQWGDWLPKSQSPNWDRFVGAHRLEIFEGEDFFKVGKHLSGRLLDGAVYSEVPS